MGVKLNSKMGHTEDSLNYSIYKISDGHFEQVK